MSETSTNNTNSTKTHPLFLFAAGSVIVASLAVAGVATGLIKKPDALSADAVNMVSGAESTNGGVTVGGTDRQATQAPRVIAQAPSRSTPAPAATCRNCGEVINIEAIRRQGEGSGLGAVAGGLAGALLGKQVGNGNGQKVATVAGAIGGAYAGNQIEKNAKSDTDYRVTVRYTDGTTQSFMFEEQPAWRIGDDVRVENGRMVAR